MSTTRITRILVGAILIVAAVLVLKAMGPQAAAVNTNMAPVGIGELRSYESSQGRISARAGFGDLRFYEASTGLAGGAVKGGSVRSRIWRPAFLRSQHWIGGRRSERRICWIWRSALARGSAICSVLKLRILCRNGRFKALRSPPEQHRTITHSLSYIPLKAPRTAEHGW